ncbi:FAD-dependent oxidoreductase [Paeniroseomonas aquatica]
MLWGRDGGLVTMRFSWRGLAREALRGHAGWTPHWRSPEQPQPGYDVVILGGGGHGLATAYYLASQHRPGRIAVLEKGWIGGGNTGRNTTIIRSNYLFPESAALYDHALQLWEGLSLALNYNVMFSPRGVMMLAHSQHDVQSGLRHVHANRLAGVDNEWLTPAEAKAFCPRSIPRRPSATRCSARRCSGAAASPATTPWPGAMRGRRARSASTSSRAARSPASTATR